MVEPLPRWAKWFVVIVVLAIAAIGVRAALDDGLEEPAPADWRIAPDADIGADATSIPIEVRERECASGRDATGRVVARVAYGERAVTIDVAVRRRGGDQECPSNPITASVVELDEPLGDRTIEGERWTTP
jgi:hypothetical protein